MDSHIILRRIKGLIIGDLVRPLIPVGFPEVDVQRQPGEVVSIAYKQLWVKFPCDPYLSFPFQAGELEKVNE